MKEAILAALIGLALLTGGYMVVNSSSYPEHCTGGPDCPCNPCPFKK